VGLIPKSATRAPGASRALFNMRTRLASSMLGSFVRVAHQDSNDGGFASHGVHCAVLDLITNCCREEMRSQNNISNQHLPKAFMMFDVR
jgi:hypothetical protein